MVSHGKRTVRAALVVIGLGLLLAAVPIVAGASPALGVVVSANPANFTPTSPPARSPTRP